MNSTSASLYGSCPSPGGVAWRRDEAARAQPTSDAARHVAIASQRCLLIRSIVIDSHRGPVESAVAVRRRHGTPMERAARPLLQLLGAQAETLSKSDGPAG